MKTIIPLLAISLFILCLAFPAQNKQEPKIVDCKVVETNEKFRSVICDVDGEFIVEFPISEWPKEWRDSIEFGSIAKIQIIDGSWIPLKSCKARIKEAEEAYEKKRVKEGYVNTGFYIPKDCQ